MSKTKNLLFYVIVMAQWFRGDRTREIARVQHSTQEVLLIESVMFRLSCSCQYGNKAKQTR